MICELTGMEVANASMYDGSTGAAEAVMMAVRVTGRNPLLIARSVHPEYREVLATYAQAPGMPLATVGFADTGRVDLKASKAPITDDTACVLIQSPNFFGTIEDVAAIADIAHKKGALLIVSIAEAVSLGIVEPPREADIVAMEAQSSACRSASAAVLRRDRDEREICPPDARTSRRADHRHATASAASS